jgi:excisionase family DNA binding protein
VPAQPQLDNSDSRRAQPLAGYVDIKDAADRLEVSTKTIRRYIQSGKIRADKIRNVWFIPEKEVEALLQESEPEPLAAAADPGLALEIKSGLDQINERLEHMDRRLSALEGPRDETLEELEDLRGRTEQLDEENNALRDEIRNLKQELASAKSERALPQLHGTKNRAEETEALKATIISNERGLALLREEVRHKDAVIKEKEQEILQLLEKLKEMESLRKPVKNPPGRSRIWGSFIRGDNPSDRS